MARLPRFVLLGHPQHVIQRGNNRQECFCDTSDYRFYLDKLHAASVKHACEIHAYVLMTSHVHLLVTPRREDAIGKMMQTLGRYYVQYYNYCYKRTGTLWEGRYKATLIDSETYLLTCMRYIELNPVRANHMAEHPPSQGRCEAPRREARDSPSVRSTASASAKDAPGRRVTVEETVRSNGFRTQDSRGERNSRRRDEGAGRRDRTAHTESHDAIAVQYPWPSYRHNALGREDRLVTPHLEYQRLGKTWEEQQIAYRQLFRAKMAERTLDEIRQATNKAWVLGNDHFKRRIEAQLRRRVEPKARGGDRKSAERGINRV